MTRDTSGGGRVAAVAIGRNEGERLRCCLESLRDKGMAAVYVDSGSTDGSVALARGLGVDVVELDAELPFTAARARNAGFDRLSAFAPDARYVQFLDGDCEVVGGWMARAAEALDADTSAAVVFGRRQERFPGGSVYNRLADMEWNVRGPGEPVEGRAESCGGDAMMRVEAFRAAGGFDPSVPAGEEPELCRRLRASGWAVLRLDADMTRHDAAMIRFPQWARRQIRTGYGGLDVSTRFGRAGADPFRRQIVSARCWAAGVPALIAGTAAAAAWAGGPAAAAAAALAAIALPAAQAGRIAARHRGQAVDARTAAVYGVLTLVSKPLQVYGQWTYLNDRLAGRRARLIEYKARATDPDPATATAPEAARA